ncbi:MAG: hypothetical protein K1X94_09695 [Sandaracinaceae bacterium]|nr:hypothetical protein [Sandaracinaceae bacterium]
MTNLIDEAKRVLALDNDARLDGMEALFERAGFLEKWPGKHDLAEWKELTPEQQAIVRIVAEVPEAAGAVGWGVPRRPRELQRFAGLLPPGPLESIGEGGAPRWRVIDHLTRKKVAWDEALARGLEGLSNVDRMRALLISPRSRTASRRTRRLASHPSSYATRSSRRATRARRSWSR